MTTPPLDVYYKDADGGTTTEVWKTIQDGTLQFTSATVEVHPHSEAFWQLQAFAGLALWCRFILFLRVFDGTSFLIHMIVEVIKALAPFLVVLLLSILAFTDAFYSMNKSYAPEDRQADMESYLGTLYYSILTTFGHFDVAGFGDIGMIFFIQACAINLIILLNLVIAIIGAIFSIVNASRIEAFYAERAELIADVWTIFPSLNPDRRAATRLLFFATELTVTEIASQMEENRVEEQEQ